MSALIPSRRFSEFTFDQHADVPDAVYTRHVDDVKAAYSAMSQTAREIIPDTHCRSIHIVPQVVSEIADKPGVLDYYSLQNGSITFSALPDMDRLPTFLRRLEEDFPFRATHELYHPVIIKIAAPGGRMNKSYMAARAEALQKIREEYPQVQGALDPILAALRQWAEADAAGREQMRAQVMHMAGVGSELMPRDQVAFYAGLLLSDEYHKAFGYTAIPAMVPPKPDVTYDEDLCNIKALAHKFGRDNVQAVAGGLLDHVEGQERIYQECHEAEKQLVQLSGPDVAQQRADVFRVINRLRGQLPEGGEESGRGAKSPP